MPWDELPPGERPEPRQAGFLQVLLAVFSSFFGVRRKAAGERDMVTIRPVQVILAGVLGAAILVALVVLLVRYVTRQG